MVVHVVGNVCLDATFRLARFPEAGETLNADASTVALGGKGANQALAACQTGARTTLWAAVGADADGAEIRRRLTEAGLSDSGISTVEAPSDRSAILVDAKGENLIVSAVEAARAFRAERGGWIEAAVPGDILMMQNNLAVDVTAACLRTAKARGLFVIVNASPLGAHENPALGDVDIVVVNRGEGEMLTGAREPSAIAAALRAMGARCVLVTLGPDGALFNEGGRVAVLPAPAVEVVDTSGAGDALCGTLAGCLDGGHTLDLALDVAIRAAALAVTRRGAFGSGPSRDDFPSLLRKETA